MNAHLDDPFIYCFICNNQQTSVWKLRQVHCLWLCPTSMQMVPANTLQQHQLTRLVKLHLSHFFFESLLNNFNILIQASKIFWNVFIRFHLDTNSGDFKQYYYIAIGLALFA